MSELLPVYSPVSPGADNHPGHEAAQCPEVKRVRKGEAPGARAGAELLAEVPGVVVELVDTSGAG